MQTKVCTKCGEEKELTEFYKNKLGKFGVKSRCKICVSGWRKNYYKENPEYFKNYYKENREKMLGDNKKWRKENRKDRLEYLKNYYKENREEMLEYMKDWRKENPEKSRVYLANRRAMKLQATPPWLCENLDCELSKIYANCPEGYHVDHIVPLKGKTVSGLHVPWNLQYLTPEENLSKNNRWWPDMWEEVDEQET